MSVAASFVLLAFAMGTLGSNSTLILRAHYPSASGSSFQVRGVGPALQGWGSPVAMKADSTGTSWSVKLSWDSSFAGQQITYKILKDGAWQVGSNVVALLKAGATVDVYPWYQSSTGVYSVMASLSSNVLNNTRDIVVYTPPSYNENTLKKYRRVLVMHDGQNLFNDSTSFAGVAWRIQDTMNSLIVQGTMEEILVVGVYNTPNRIAEYTYSYDPTVGDGGKGDLYLDFLDKIVLPWARSNLRIASDATYDMLGSSLGGLISCYAGWTRPRVWTRVGCMSSSFWWNSQDFNTTILVKYPNPPQPRMIYIDTGNDEGSDPKSQVQQTELIVNRISKFPHWNINQNLQYYLDMGGQHSEYFWGHRFWSPMQFLYPGAGI